MSDLKTYIAKRKLTDPEFLKSYDADYNDFKIGLLLKEARIKAGLTQNELASLVHTKKSAISRIENHSDDVKLSTIQKIAEALGKILEVRLV